MPGTSHDMPGISLLSGQVWPKQLGRNAARGRS